VYRLESVDQFFTLGLTEFFPDAIALIEWGNKISEYLDDYILVKIEHGTDDKNSRKFTFSSEGKDELLGKLEKSLV
jgi:tRNA threonylcarbamoyladenosine biosynthesis protein TsaE